MSTLPLTINWSTTHDLSTNKQSKPSWQQNKHPSRANPYQAKTQPHNLKLIQPDLRNQALHQTTTKSHKTKTNSDRRFTFLVKTENWKEKEPPYSGWQTHKGEGRSHWVAELNWRRVNDPRKVVKLPCRARKRPTKGRETLTRNGRALSEWPCDREIAGLSAR